MTIGPLFLIVGTVFTAQGHWQASWAIVLGLLITAYYAKKPRKPVTATTAKPQRRALTEKVRHEVWRRDQGRCVDCQGRTNLEYDHIIAVSRGGSNTARNVELRCETCNRRKGARV
jgi:hypothetical protein